VFVCRRGVGGTELDELAWGHRHVMEDDVAWEMGLDVIFQDECRPQQLEQKRQRAPWRGKWVLT